MWHKKIISQTSNLFGLSTKIASFCVAVEKSALHMVISQLLFFIFFHIKWEKKLGVVTPKPISHPHEK